MKALLVSLVQKIHIKTDINLNKIKIKDSITEWQLQINNSLYLEITFSDIKKKDKLNLKFISRIRKICQGDFYIIILKKRGNHLNEDISF